MNFNSLLIVTYGRSGSTLLQGLCNALPGCVIRGENYNFCHGLFNAWTQVARTKCEYGSHGSDRPESPWFGASGLDPERFLASARVLVEQQLMGELKGERPACLGFKEIRYLPDSLIGSAGDYRQRLTAYLDFLAVLMPKPAILFLTRDAEQVARSAWWREREPAKVKQLLSQFATVTKDYRHPHCPSFHVDYADLMANGEQVGKLFDFLGAPRNPDLVQEVLGRNHSYSASTVAASNAPERGLLSVGPEGSSESTGKSSLPKFHLSGYLPATLALVAPDQPQRAKGGGEDLFVWNGVAVAADTQGTMSLAMQTPAGLVPLTWGSASPWAATQLPDNPAARKARYIGPPVMLRPGQSCTLVLMHAGTIVPLAELRRGSS